MPVNYIDIQQICPLCGGDGLLVLPHNTENPPPSETECPQCEGEGYVASGRIHVAPLIEAILNP